MALKSRTRLLATALLCMSVLGTAWGLDTGIHTTNDASPLNLPMPTLGGKQLWADRYIYAGWRIQQHVYTGHFRLLDPQDIRHAWGTQAECQAAFAAIRSREALAPQSRHLVLLVHGLARSKDSFAALQQALHAAGYETTAINYPSTRRSIGAHTEQLEELLNTLEDVDTVSFITHSMGGLVVRETLQRQGAWRERIMVNGVAMLAPPSRGAAAADALQDLAPYRWVAGPAGQELTTRDAANIPLPMARTCIIAGGRGEEAGYNPWLAGDDDGVVRVEEARLAGVDDFLLVPTIHTFVIGHPNTHEALLRFLAGGRCAADAADTVSG